MARLVVQHKDRDPQVYQIVGPVTVIGRGDDTDLLLPDVSVSRSHCSVRRTADGWEIKDMQSSNGTLLNGRKMQCKPLGDGDRIQIGKFLLSFEAPVGEMETNEKARELGDFSLDDERPGFLARLSTLEGPTAQGTSRLDAKSLKAARLAARLAQDAQICTVGLDEMEYSPGEAGISFGGKKGIPVKGMGIGAKVRIAWNGRSHVLVKDGGMMTRVEVNGNKIKSHVLKVGDEITVGKSAFVYKLPR
jgi:pSer/pThr/pTyr-binding forkhead associated (FHA) protein